MENVGLHGLVAGNQYVFSYSNGNKLNKES